MTEWPTLEGRVFPLRIDLEADRRGGWSSQCLRPLLIGVTSGRETRRVPMAKFGVPHFHNDVGVEKIHIGVKEFQCMGARPPMDHPHVYLDMGSDDQIVCPYCSTLYIYDGNLRPDQSDPPYCLYDPEGADAR
jgi:uncharacterized Zn-finger protein